MMLQVKGVSDSGTYEVAIPLPHPPQRRPRVREVSSRFMPPVASSYSCGPTAKSTVLKQQRLISAQLQKRHLEMEADGNWPAPSESDSLETSFMNTDSNTNMQKKHPHFGTYSDSGNLQRSTRSALLKPDTPTLTITSLERTASMSSSSLSSSSKIRLNHLPANKSSVTTASAASKLLQCSRTSSKFNASSSSQEASPVSANAMGSIAGSLLDFRSAMREADLLHSVCTILHTDRNVNKDGDSSKLHASPFSRSLSSPLSTCDPYLFHRPNPPIKGVSTEMAPLSLPPVPSHTKPRTDAKRRPKKVSGHQEDMQSLKLLHNYYLQWRYANARAEASMQIQKRETERTLYSLDMKILALYDSVRRRRIELQLLQRMNTLPKILEGQMPYLEEWSAFQGDYLNSLSEVIQSLLNASLRLPMSGNVEADTKNVGDAMGSAIKLMEMILNHVQILMPKAEEMESLISELARVVGGERILIEEYGYLLTKTSTLQVEECSLRGQLIRLQ